MDDGKRRSAEPARACPSLTSHSISKAARYHTEPARACQGGARSRGDGQIELSMVACGLVCGLVCVLT